MDGNNVFRNEENSGVNELPKAPEAPEAPKATPAPKAAETPSRPYYAPMGEAPKAPEVKAPEAPKAPEVKAPEAPKAPARPYYTPSASAPVSTPKAPDATGHQNQAGTYTVQNPSPYMNNAAKVPPVPPAPPAPSAAPDGEYVRPTVTPVPAQKKSNGLMIALIIVSAVLIFTIIAGMASIIYLSRNQVGGSAESSTAESGNEVVIGDDKEDNDQENKPAPNVNVVEQSKDDSKKMDIEDVVAKTLPQVVGVVATSGKGFYASEGQGSGIILSSDGYIITNAHVVEGATTVKIVLPDAEQTSYDAQVIGEDTKTDLAVLKVEATNLNAADIGNSTELSLGETVVAIGNPYGLELQSSVTSGIVSALDRSVSTSNGKMKLIQTDAAINPGNSGGALVNLYGQVVGICSSKISDLDAEGLGFAIPISDAIPIVKELISKGYVSGRPMIGIQGQDIGMQQSMMYGIPVGVYVVYVEEGSPADKAGLEEYDVITKFNGKEITCFTDLDAAKDECKAGDTVEIEFYRYDERKTMTAQITLSESTGK